jgi:hypothetical protein
VCSVGTEKANTGPGYPRRTENSRTSDNSSTTQAVELKLLVVDEKNRKLIGLLRQKIFLHSEFNVTVMIMIIIIIATT